MNFLFKYKLPVLLLGILCVFLSCTDENNVVDIDAQAKECFVKLEFDLPTNMHPSGVSTRTMSHKDENAIDSDLISVFVFEKNDNDYKFSYEAPIRKGSLQTNVATPNRATLVLSLLKTQKSVEILIVANHATVGLDLKKGVSTKENFLEQLTYTMPTGVDGNNIWPVELKTPFPIYGEIKSDGINENKSSFEIPLYRALARIDVGVNFQHSQSVAGGPYEETAIGLECFDLQNIRIYNTLDKGCVGYTKGYIGNSPTVPAVNRRSTPLYYSVDDVSNEAFVREIYVPEAESVGEKTSTELCKDMHTIIIGGKFKGGETTYYKLDFAQESSTGSKKRYYPILRNHRYVFNITDVRAPGFKTFEEALNSVGTTNVDYELVTWDDSIHEMQIKGKHYFGLDNRNLVFGYRKNDDTYNISCQTNYPITPQSPLSLKWESTDDVTSDYFEATWNEASKEITIKTLQNNESNVVKTDVLHVTVGDFEILVNVSQDYLNFVYNIDCSTVSVSGVYRPSHELTAMNEITLDIKAADERMIGLRYELYTEPLNGIQFKAEGVFTANTKTIKLKGTGILETPLGDRTTPFSVIIRSNSSSGSYCEATITPVNSAVTIFSTGSDNGFGYNLYTDKPGRKMLKEPLNFGYDDASRVKIEGINIENGEKGKDITLLDKWLRGRGNEGKLADIFHIAFNVDTEKASSKYVREYLENGGVGIFLLDTDKQALPILTELFRGNVSYKEFVDTKRFSYKETLRNIFPFKGNDVYKQAKTALEWTEYLQELKQDPILNGPFGDVSEEQWGEDASSATGVKGLPLDDSSLTVYTTLEYLDGERLNRENKEYVSIFKYESDNYNFVFIGDGGFTSQTINGSNLRTICRFTIDENSFPIPKKYQHGYEVYNSTFFANVMAWAVEKANSPEMIKKKEAYRKAYKGL